MLMRLSRFIQFATTAGALACALGCATVKQAYEPAPEPAPQLPVDEALVNPDFQEAARSDGSLFSTASQDIYNDDKAWREGDIVLVKVVQNNTGTKQANTDTARESSVSARIKYALGLEQPVNKLTGYQNDFEAGERGTTWDPDPLVEASTSNEFKGEGSTNRSDTLTATVSAIVTDVLNNGNLVIYGHQTVTLNNEASVLTVQGIVRPSDISIDNMVASERMANASIEFTGSGVITDKQHPGWATRALDWVWPF